MNAEEMVDVVTAVVQLLFPAADIVPRSPRDPKHGHWWVDVYNGPDGSFVIEFRPPDKWGVSRINREDTWTGPDEVFAEPSSLIAWLVRNRK